MRLPNFEFGAQKIVYRAVQYARSLGHQVVEVEHLALAVIRSEVVLAHAPVVQQSIRHHLEEKLKRIPRRSILSEPCLSPHLGRLFDLLERGRKGHPITWSHLWQQMLEHCSQLAPIKTMMRDHQKSQSSFQPLYDKFSQDMKATKASAAKQKKNNSTETNAEVNSNLDQSGSSSPGSMWSDPEEKAFAQLDGFVTDLSAVAERQEMDPVLGRDDEIRRVIQILGRRKKNNPILLGEPGVGKTAIAEGLALRICQRQVPDYLKAKRILALDVSALVAGTRYRGEFEERMKKVIDAGVLLKDRVIFFIDEIHTVVGAGNQEGGGDIANLLKPVLARGDFCVLGATTLAEFRKYIEKDAALERRFQPIYVEEPNVDSALAILRGVKAKYEVHHGVRITDEALHAAVRLSARFLPDRRLPDKAIDIIDEAATRLRFDIESMPADIDHLRAQIEELQVEMRAIDQHEQNSRLAVRLKIQLQNAQKKYHHLESIWQEFRKLSDDLQSFERERSEAIALLEDRKHDADYDFAAKIQYEELPLIESKLKGLKDQIQSLQGQHRFLTLEVGPREIARVLSSWTHVPVDQLVEHLQPDYHALARRLSERVIGQAHVVETLMRVVKKIKFGLQMSPRPLGVLFFAGPTGVGKTELAKGLASEVFGDASAMIRIDMSEYAEAHQVARLLGAPPGYTGYEAGSVLVDALRVHAHCLILLDEIEKAHPRVFDIFLQAFDEGRLSDSQGRKLDLRNVLFVMTSNLEIDQPVFFSGTFAEESALRQNLSQHLRPELVNRIDEIFVFRPLTAAHCQSIIERMVSDYNQRLAEMEIRIHLEAEVVQYIMDQAQVPLSGGRGIRRAFERIVITSLADLQSEKGQKVKGSWCLGIENGVLAWRLEFRPERYLPSAS